MWKKSVFVERVPITYLKLFFQGTFCVNIETIWKNISARRIGFICLVK